MSSPAPDDATPRPAAPTGPAAPRVDAAPEVDVAALRALVPALGEGLAFFDGPGGTQVPTPVADAVTAMLGQAVSNRKGPHHASRRAEEAVDAARRAVADLVGGVPEGWSSGRR